MHMPCRPQAPGRRGASPSADGSLSCTVADLKERLRALGQPLAGRKPQLLERLKAALEADTAGSREELPVGEEAEAGPGEHIDCIDFVTMLTDRDCQRKVRLEPAQVRPIHD